jgi:hypothetical protein
MTDERISKEALELLRRTKLEAARKRQFRKMLEIQPYEPNLPEPPPVLFGTMRVPLDLALRLKPDGESR